ncbi:MAG TPA: DUF6159 family protein [Acidimicrobiia bacterium]|nr:DUF6159 family protein [Acidimicrobiia bacterium]
MGRISRTFELAGSSWRVLKADKELILLPVMSLIATIAVAVSFLIPLLDSCTADTGGGTASCELATTDYVLLGMMYVALAFITIFFNAALVYAANQRMSGGDPTVGSALRGAALRVHRIFPWALVSATVSVILRAIEERAGVFGRIIAGIAGIAWALVTFLVIPVLVIEDVGVREAVKRSGAMFKRTWGENVAAQVGFGLLGFLLVLPAIAVIAFGFGTGGVTAVVLVAAGVAWILLVSLVLAALSGVFQTALYHFAAGTGTTGFPAATLEAAFAPKRGGGNLRVPRGFAG